MAIQTYIYILPEQKLGSLKMEKGLKMRTTWSTGNRLLVGPQKIGLAC